MVFVALKPCRFGGTDYLIGESIPADRVLPEQVEALRAMGIISIGFEEVVNQLDESLRDAMEDQHTVRRDGASKTVRSRMTTSFGSFFCSAASSLKLQLIAFL